MEDYQRLGYDDAVNGTMSHRPHFTDTGALRAYHLGIKEGLEKNVEWANEELEKWITYLDKLAQGD